MFLERCVSIWEKQVAFVTLTYINILFLHPNFEVSWLTLGTFNWDTSDTWKGYCYHVTIVCFPWGCMLSAPSYFITEAEIPLLLLWSSKEVSVCLAVELVSTLPGPEPSSVPVCTLSSSVLILFSRTSFVFISTHFYSFLFLIFSQFAKLPTAELTVISKDEK